MPVKKQRIWLKDSAKRFYRIVLYLLTVFIIVFLFPREGKFRYEFQKGRPWMHESLIAPFDFPIYKLSEEVEAEKDSILKSYNPYFTYESKIWEDVKPRLHDYLARKYRNYLEKNESLKSILQPKEAMYVDSLLLFFGSAYNKGIVEFPENITAKTIIIIRNSIADETDWGDYFTPKSAYRYIQNNITSFSKHFMINNSTPLESFVKEIHFDNFIKSNTFYDAVSSENASQELIKKVSLTEGLVQRGERIILTGDIVNEQTYRILSSLKTESENRIGKVGNYYIIILGHTIFSAFIVLLLFLYLHHYRKESGNPNVNTLFFVLILLIMVVLASLFLKYQIASIYIIPFALIPIIINSFFDSKLAFVVHVLIITLIGFWAPNSFEFMLLNIAAGIMVSLRLSNQFSRNRIFFTSLMVILTYSVLFYSKYLIQEADWRSIDFKHFSYFAVNGLLLLTSIPLIYFFEKVFGFLSDTTLLEISDTNQPLLKKLAETAPGTFQHTLQVSNLSEEAIRSIGGNTLLVRAGALYHDIGKLKNPQYFIENQINVNNPHDSLEELNSAKIIIEHIEEGVALAKKYSLPEPVIDFIRSHHGDSPVMYFYKLFIKKHPEEQADLSKFTYPGPKPKTKEVAVVLLADSVEAASRSLKSYTAKSINDLVEIIVNTYLDKGQLNEANITMKEITQLKEVFKDRLRNIYHLRIMYPE